MAYTVCDVTAAHIPQIEVLEQQCFSTPWTAELLRSQMKDAQHEFIAALSPEGTVLGYVGMMYVLDEGYISNVAVSPNHRRQGIADTLIDSLCAICEPLHLRFVTLEDRDGNVPAIALYEEHGLHRVGRCRNY